MLNNIDDQEYLHKYASAGNSAGKEPTIEIKDQEQDHYQSEVNFVVKPLMYSNYTGGVIMEDSGESATNSVVDQNDIQTGSVKTLRSSQHQMKTPQKIN